MNERLDHGDDYANIIKMGDNFMQTYNKSNQIIQKRKVNNITYNNFRNG